jgi:TP901 family phage tail tape measure protein
MNEDFKLILQTVADLSKIQSQINKESKNIKLKASLDTSDIQKQIHNLAKTQKDALSSFYNTNSNGSKEYINTWKKLLNQQDLMNDKLDITKTRAEGAGRGFSAYLKTLKSSALKQYSTEINGISDAFTKASETGNRVDYSKAQASLSRFKSTMKDAGMETASFTQIIKDNISAFSNWYIIGNIVSGVVRNFSNAIQTITEVDTLLTEISKTSELTGDKLKSLGINAYDYASKYGSTVQSYLSGYLEMSRGTDEITAKGLAELSILAQSAGDMTAELANNYIVATNAAYELENNVSKLNEVLDGQNQITNRNQVSMTDLATATSVAGAQAAQSGVAINEMTAAMGTMIASTKQGGEVAGRAFKGILMNLQQVSGEIDGEVFDTTSFKKVEETLNDVGVATEKIVDGTAKLRDPIVILKELASVYNSLPDDSVDKANIIADLGGKYRGNQLAALLSNWKTYEKMLSDYTQSSGSAAKEAQKTADSIEGRLNKLTNTWNRTVANVVDSDIIKAFVSIGTGAVDLADNMDILQTALIGLAIAGGGKALTSLVSHFNSAIDSTVAFGNALKLTEGLQASSSYYTTLTNSIQGLSISQASAILSTQSLQKAEMEAILVNAGFSAEQSATTASTLAMSAAQTTATGTTFSLSAAWKGLTATIAANPIGAILTGLTVAVSAISFGINKYKQSQEEALQTSKELTQAYKDEKSSLDEQVSLYTKLQKQLELGNLSTEETKSIKEQLLGIQGNLIGSYDDEASGIDLVNGKYKEQIELLSDLSKNKAQDFIAENKSTYEDAIDALNEIRNFDIGNIGTNLDNGNGLVDFFRNYNNQNVQLNDSTSTGRGISTTQYSVKISADTTEAESTLRQLYQDVEKWGLDNNVNVTNTLSSISDQIQSVWTDKLDDYKNIYDEFISAQVVANDTLRPLYQQSIQAIEDYNNALAFGEGIDQAQLNLNNIKNTVSQNTKLVEGSESVFEDLFATIVTGSQQSGSAISNGLGRTVSNVIAENEEAIDNYQKSIQTLKSALSDASSLSSSDLLDLMQEYSSFDWEDYGVTGASGIGNITGALKELVRQQYNNLDSTLQSNAALTQMRDDALDAAEGIVKLTDDISTKEQSDEEFYQSVLVNLDESIKKQAEKYQLDFDNYHNLLEAKLALDKEYALKQQELINAEMNFRNVMYGGDVERIKQLASEWSNAQTAFDDYRNIATGFNTSLSNTASTYKSGSSKKDDPYLDEFNNKKDTLKYRLDKDEITESTYYSELDKLNNKYFKNHQEKYIEQYRQNEVEVYQGRNKLADKSKDDALKAEKDRLDDYYSSIENVLNQYDNALSNFDRSASNSDKGSDSQLSYLAKGASTAGEKVKYLEDTIKSLNKQYKGDKSNENYIDTLDKLTDSLADAKDAVLDYQESILDSITDRLDEQTKSMEKAYDAEVDAMEDAHKETMDALDEELKAQKKIIDAKKESLNREKDLRDYTDNVADTTAEIARLEARKIELQRAANNDDTSAQSELRDLDEDLYKAKDKLEDTHSDRKYKLAEEALDDELEKFEGNIEIEQSRLEETHNLDLANAKETFDTKLANITTLYTKEKELIADAAKYTREELGKALQDVYSQLSANGINTPDSTYNAMMGSYDAMKSASTHNQVLSVLQNGKGTGAGTSDLNDHVRQMYGSQLSYAQMVEVAKLLGVSGIDDVKDVIGNSANKDKILKALKAASFTSGGYINGTSAAKSVGEDYAILAKRGEYMWDKTDSAIFKKEFIPLMKNMTQQFKPTMPNISNINTTNNSSAPHIEINLNGTYTEAAKPLLNTFTHDVSTEIINIFRKS